MSAADTALVDRLELAWSRLRDLGAGLDDAGWSAATECPGWDVKDNVAHLAGLERRLLAGAPAPEAGTPLSVVQDELRRWNDADVEARRPWPGSRVLADFEEVTAARLAALRAYSDDDFAAPTWTPVGAGQARDLLGFRILDTWVHDQDIRRALGRPGHQEGPVAEHTLARLVGGLPLVVGKRVSPPEGTTIAFNLSGPAFPAGRRVAVGITGGRARLLPDPPAEATAVLGLEEDDFVRLTCGRGDPEAILANVSVTGDKALARRVARHLNFMP